MMTTRFLRRRLRAGPIALICLAGSLCCNDAAAQKSDDPNPQDKGESAMTTAEKAKTHKFTNRLIHTTSPYLLQHAHNPVDWYPWGPEALERARKENKPIFLSIGYSACHWCHVMERECFENEDIAAVMNTHFVCIKVDREERPDLDDIYMAATQALTRSGGWPMSVWLTPDQRPFYAGTYFPPDDRYGPQKNFKTLLIGLAEAWKNQHDQMDQQADRLTEAVKQMTRFEPGHEDVPYEVITRTAGFLAGRFDSIKGGMSGGRNKFPPSMAMDLMLRAYHASLADGKTPDTRLLELVELTLQKMAFGGIYDHLGGGFARYSTDPDWLAPHFEKMLYDQALISDIYLKAYQVTGKPLYARIAREIFDYVMTDLQGPGGGFYSTRDADSEGEEGRFYVWSRSEIVSILGPEEAEAFCEYYDVTEKGNWESHNILNVKRPNDQTHRRLEAARKKLFDVREKRIRPHLDDKILAAWNGLMIASMARGHRILGEPRYGEAAARAAEFVTTKMRDEQGRLMRTYRNGQTHTPGYLDDYAFMIDALLTLYEATFETRWLDQAERLNARLMANYLDKEEGGFFFTAADAEKVLVRAKSAVDSAIPSGSSVQFMNLQRLAVLLDRRPLAAEAERMLRFFGNRISKSPFSSERMLAGVDFFHRRPREIAFVCKAEDTAALDSLIAAAWRAYVPNAVFARLIEDDTDAKSTVKRIPFLSHKTTIDGKPTVYVCKNFACKRPTTDEKTMLSQIGP